MKNILYFMIASIIISSCNTTNESIKENENPLEIGSVKMDNGQINAVIGGEINNQKIWLEYIKAHNNKNLEKIAEINADDWIGYTADGSVVKGNDAHIEILRNWFESANPKWEVKWMIANAANNEEGILTQWLTTGNDYSDVDENGNEIFEHNVHDIRFKDGKIKEIRVYKRAKPEESSDFSY